MKSIRLFAAFAVTLAAIACNKEQAAPDQEIDTQEPQNEITDVPEGYVRLTFSTPAETKTSIDKESGAVSWTAGDQIKICWEGGSAVSDEVSIEGGVARFTANVAEAAEDLYAVYPSGLTASVSSGTLSVDIPQSQSGRFADADIIVAKTTKTELTYAFHHAVSLVRFVISDGNSRSITRAQFVDLANNSCLYGTLGITFSGTDINEITEPTTEANDVIDITAVAEGDNWIAVPPTKSLTGYGLRMGTSSAWLPGIVGEKPYEFTAAGKRLGLGTVDEKINDGDWYIKPEATGTGDGKSWENAGGPAMLQSLMGDYSSGDAKNLARAWRINGKKIKVAEGYYTASGVNGFTARYKGGDSVAITIEGGYTSSGTKSASAQTVFGPETGTDPYRAFFLYGDKLSVTLKDLYCSNHERTGSAGGGAIYSAGMSKLVVNGCSIIGNATKNSRAGGAILSEGQSLEICDCSFSGNTAATQGGAIYTTSNTSIEGSKFASNIGNGGAIGVGGSATVKTNRCKFLGNHSSGKNTSGTININSSTCKAFFNACEFRRNYVASVTNGGAITYCKSDYSGSKIGFNNCTITQNNTEATSFCICTNGSCIVSNTTIIDQSLTAANASLLYVLGTGISTFVNSIVINENTTENYGGPRKTGTCTLITRFNIYSNYKDFDPDESDVTGILSLPDGESNEIEDMPNMSYYSWTSGTVTGYTQTNATTVANTIKANTSFGEEFYNWLDSLVDGADTALDYDICGVARSNGYWPGSYQNN